MMSATARTTCTALTARTTRRRTRAAILALVVLAFALVFASTALAEKKIALSSGSFAFEVSPGQTGDGEIVVINDGDEPIKVLVYVADVEIDEAGEQSYPLPSRDGASLLTSPASWIRVYMPADSKSVGNTPYLELDVGERIPVKFDFSPPANATPGDHNVVMFFEMFDFAPDSGGTATQVTGRIGARIQMRVLGEYIEKLEVRPFEVPAFKVGTVVPYRFTLRNEGNVNERVTGTVTLLDRNEREIASAEVASDTPVYARAQLEFEGSVESVTGLFGRHIVELRLVYPPIDGTTPVEVVEQREVWMVPVWALIAAGVLVFVLAVWGAKRLVTGGRTRGHAVTTTATRTAAEADGGMPIRPSRPADRPDPDERRRLREQRARERDSARDAP